MAARVMPVALCSVVLMSMMFDVLSDATFHLVLQLYSLTVPAGAAVPLNGTGSVDIPTTAPAVLHLQNLKSQTEYRICSIAYDATQVHNKQALGQERLFTTLDITPPTLSIAVLPGADGGVTCER